jgi:hypothetical protein
MVLAVGMLFLFLHLELNRTLAYAFAPLRLPILSLLWIGMCAYLLYEYLARPSSLLLGLVVTMAAAVLGKLLLFDLPSWHLELMRYEGDYSFLDGTMRLLDFGVIVAFFCWGYLSLGGNADARKASVVLGTTGLVLTFVFLTLEVNSILHFFAPGLRAGGVSILWALFALGLLLSGILRNVSALRYAALALFTVVAGKVFFGDLARLDAFYRIIAFLCLGVLVLAASFVYLKFRHTFLTDKGNVEEVRP